ncbi:AbiV family abortive infection protein [Planococcus shenhongbingii]|uniref:AbiV family abortive infection protein n=1 Tax=Planococcus shenhongbingii TaxID=3058398 RepID=UPI0026117537|nr:AbiV family abortive infection protein [Planococcus sp. N016]WKA60295.1 AbiV family abortive infection protein [Planococcus sp. N016]
MGFNQLKVEDIEIIQQKIYENAIELLEDAELLYNNEKYARAHACAQFSIEEFGKLPMLLTVSAQVSKGDKVNWKDLNNRLRDHKTKTSLSFALIEVMVRSMIEKIKVENIEDYQLDLYVLFPDSINDFKKFLEQDFELVPYAIFESLDKSREELSKEYRVRQAVASVLNKYKNLSLYADFNDGDFVKPSEVIHEKRSRDRIKAALIQQKIMKILHPANNAPYKIKNFSLFDSIQAELRNKIFEEK